MCRERNVREFELRKNVNESLKRLNWTSKDEYKKSIIHAYE